MPPRADRESWVGRVTGTIDVSREFKRARKRAVHAHVQVQNDDGRGEKRIFQLLAKSSTKTPHKHTLPPTPLRHEGEEEKILVVSWRVGGRLGCRPVTRHWGAFCRPSWQTAAGLCLSSLLPPLLSLLSPSEYSRKSKGSPFQTLPQRTGRRAPTSHRVHPDTCRGS